MERGILNYLASSHFNPEIKQHKNMTILRWETAKEFPVLLARVKILCWLKASPMVIVYSSCPSQAERLQPFTSSTNTSGEQNILANVV